jgi:hypothetical protein
MTTVGDVVADRSLMSAGAIPRLLRPGSRRRRKKGIACRARLSGNTQRARVSTRNFGGATPSSPAMPIVRIAAAPRCDKRCPRDHFGPTVLDFLTWPAMWRSGLRIVRTNVIAALRWTAQLGPRVSAGYAEARSPARRMSYAQRRASDTITMCATTLTEFTFVRDLREPKARLERPRLSLSSSPGGTPVSSFPLRTMSVPGLGAGSAKIAAASP